MNINRFFTSEGRMNLISPFPHLFHGTSSVSFSYQKEEIRRRITIANQIMKEDSYMSRSFL